MIPTVLKNPSIIALILLAIAVGINMLGHLTPEFRDGTNLFLILAFTLLAAYVIKRE